MIAWYQNDGGSPPSFAERVISTTATAALSVFATDVNGDGEIDVLSASWFDNKIAWYESDGGSPPTFTERVISTAANGASSVFATDLDGDGDTDVLSTSQSDNKIVWYENLCQGRFDSDCDGDVDLEDFALFQVGFASPKNLPGFALFQEALSGPK